MQAQIVIAAALLVATSAIVTAQPKSKGASEFTPGDQMQDSGRTTKGASQYSPGHEMKKHGKTSKGASEFSPGDRKNDLRITQGKKG